jgi:murein L,D-transpeptidase YcbB/YkuD
MQPDEPAVISLPQPLPVQLMYLTAFVADASTINFRKDIYSHGELPIEAIR